jgi:hypothetical protein
MGILRYSMKYIFVIHISNIIYINTLLYKLHLKLILFMIHLFDVVDILLFMVLLPLRRKNTILGLIEANLS